MSTDYVDWLLQIYVSLTGKQPADPDPVDRAMKIIRWNGRSLPCEEDYTSMVVAETASQIESIKARKPESGNADDVPDFFVLLRRAADRVKHRIAREIRRRAETSDAALDNVASTETAVETIENVIAAGLTLEEQVILSMLLQNASPQDVASQLGISLRTFHRRVMAIRSRLEHS